MHIWTELDLLLVICDRRVEVVRSIQQILNLNLAPYWLFNVDANKCHWLIKCERRVHRNISSELKVKHNKY